MKSPSDGDIQQKVGTNSTNLQVSVVICAILYSEPKENNFVFKGKYLLCFYLPFLSIGCFFVFVFCFSGFSMVIIIDHVEI